MVPCDFIIALCHGCERFAGFKEGERERIANHFTNRFQLDMLDRELSVKVGLTSPPIVFMYI